MSLSHSSSHHNKTFSFSSYSSSSSSSFSSCVSNCESPTNPISPLQSFGVPFSWEHRPGIRRKSHFSQTYKETCLDLLPLPPAARSSPTNEFKKLRFNYIGRDPFAVALVKCSNKDLCSKSVDDYWKVAKASRAVNDLVGIVDRYTSCKMTCSVVDSKVYIPRSGRTVYDLPNRHLSRLG